MTDVLAKRAVGGLARMQFALAVLLFGPAWSLAWWQGWLFWLVMLGCTLPITLYFLCHDRALIERRINAGPMAEHRPQQKLIQSVFSALLLVLVIVPGLGRRFGWSSVPGLAAVSGDVLVVLGFAIIFVTFRENSFAAAIIEVTPGQHVVDTGPYAWVRHPMYSGALLLFVGTPIALGSWWDPSQPPR